VARSEEQERGIRRTLFVLVAIAFGFFVTFIMMGVLNA
jgi:hypothetical protein